MAFSLTRGRKTSHETERKEETVPRKGRRKEWRWREEGKRPILFLLRFRPRRRLSHFLRPSAVLLCRPCVLAYHPPRWWCSPEKKLTPLTPPRHVRRGDIPLQKEAVPVFRHRTRPPPPSRRRRRRRLFIVVKARVVEKRGGTRFCAEKKNGFLRDRRCRHGFPSGRYSERSPHGRPERPSRAVVLEAEEVEDDHAVGKQRNTGTPLVSCVAKAKKGGVSAPLPIVVVHRRRRPHQPSWKCCERGVTVAHDSRKDSGVATVRCDRVAGVCSTMRLMMCHW